MNDINNILTVEEKELTENNNEKLPEIEAKEEFQ